MTPAANRAYLDLATGALRASTSGTAAPSINGTLGARLSLILAFMTGGTPEALAAGSTGRLVLKAKGSPTGAALFLDTAWTVEGSGAATTYKFDAILDSEALRTALGNNDSLEVQGTITWILNGETDVNVSQPFTVLVTNNYDRADEAPDPVGDASWGWLKARAPEANGFTHDDEAKTLEIDESDPVASAALATHEARTDNPHSVTKSQVGLGNCENTSDASKPISTATQAALDAKEPTQTPASQAEAEAGTGTAIRSWTPQRVAQAIAALGGGGSITTPKVLHVTTAGNDTTGDGSAGAPYATAQKAFDVAFAGSGNYVIKLGVGNFGNVECYSGWPVRIGLRGEGWNVSSLDLITSQMLSDGSSGAAIEIISDDSVYVDTVTGSGTDNSSVSSMGGSAASVTLTGIRFKNVRAMGGNGGPESDPGISNDGGAAGDGAMIILRGCTAMAAGDISAAAGTPGSGGASGTTGDVTEVLCDHQAQMSSVAETRTAIRCILFATDNVTASMNTETDCTSWNL